jgi:hypothetical protein
MTKIGPAQAPSFASEWIETGFTRLLQARSAEEVDRTFRNLGPQRMQALLADPDLPADARAKLVEVALLRGGREPRALLELRRGYEVALKLDPHAIVYQRLALEAVLRDPAVFEALSGDPRLLGDDAVPPATRWMEMAVAPRGWLDPEATARWMMTLPPETRGRAIFHLLDAANEADKGRVRITGGSIGLGPVDLDVEYTPKDDEWQETVNRIVQWVDRATGQADAPAFDRGARLADRWRL